MNVKNFLRSILSMTDYIDVDAAYQNVRSNVPFRGPIVYILFIAIIIAGIGLNVNSIPVIIGAMLISPLMNPIIGFGLGTNNRDLVLSSLKNLGIMVAISLLVSTLYFVLTPLEINNPTELLARTKPTIYDVMIALFGGLAGVLEISRKEKDIVLSGVANATALMPPLLAKGARGADNAEEQEELVVLIDSKRPLPKDEVKRITNWMKVRLNTENIILVNQ